MHSPRPSPTETATPGVAIALIVGSGFAFSMLDATAKWLVLAGMFAPFVAWCRFAGHALIAFAVLRPWANPAAFTVKSLPKQLLRSVFLFGSTILNFFALQTLQLAETVAIFFAAPMIITALAGPLLGEWAGWRRWLAIAGGFIGVLVVTRPGFGAFGAGHLFVLGATLSYCGYAIMTRTMTATETPTSLVFYSALLPAVLLSPAAFLYGRMPAGLLEWALVLTMGVYGGLGHWFIIKAYAQATATALAPYSYSQMIGMASLGFLIFGQLPDRWTVAGATIIVASGLYILHRERVLRLRASASIRE